MAVNTTFEQLKSRTPKKRMGASPYSYDMKRINNILLIFQGYGRIDMSDKDVVTEVLPGPILVRQGNNAVARRKILIISTEALVQGESYLLSLEAENADEKSNAQIVITTPSPPAEG